MIDLLFNLHLKNPIGVSLAGVPLVINALILAYVLQRLPRDRITSTFALFLVMLMGWQWFDLMVRLSATPETAAAWRGLLRAAQFLAVPAGFLFALQYAEHDQVADHPVAIGVVMIPGLLSAGSYNGALTVETLIELPEWGFIADHVQGPIHTTNIVWNGLLSLVMLAVLVRHWTRVRHIPTRAPGAAVMAIGFAIPTLLGVFFEVVMPIGLNLTQLPVTSTTMVVFSLATVLALTRYGLLNVSTPTAAKAMLDSLTDSLFITGPNGQILYINPTASARFGVARDRAAMHHISELLPAEQTAEFLRDVFAPTAAGERMDGVELRLRRFDGSFLPVSVSTAPVPISRGGEPGVAIIAHDVTALKRTEEALLVAKEAAEASNRAKSLFLANMSHELRTPLNAIIGYSEMLAEDFELDGRDDTVEDLRRIEGSGRYLLKLINDILDLSKVESGKVEVRLEATQIHDVADEVSVNAHDLCRKNRNTFVLDLDQLPLVIADRLRLRQVLLNLVSNAAKFTEDGTITLTGRVGDRAGQPVVLLAMRDTGIGMSSAQLGNLFKLFSQVHTVDHGKYGGTGLGLALSRRLCQAMGGDIEVSSTPNVGTTFTVVLRLANAAPAHTSGPSHDATLRVSPSGGAMTDSLDASLDSSETITAASLDVAPTGGAYTQDEALQRSISEGEVAVVTADLLPTPVPPRGRQL